MPNPKFQGRTYLRDPKDFGDPQVPRPRWELPTGGTESFLWASVVQHVHVCAIRKAIAKDRRFHSLANLCVARGLSYKRINDMLNGATVLRLEAIASLAYHLGPASLAQPAEIDKILDQAASDIEAARPARP